MRVQPAIVLTVAVIVLTTIVSGPALSLVDLTASGTLSGTDLGEGSVTVGSVTLPDTVTFERGDFGAGSYYLTVPAATVELDDVVGRPILSYEVTVHDLGFTRSTIEIISAESEGTMELTLDEAAFGEHQIRNQSYAGRLRVDVRYGGQEHVLASKNVTIEVVE